MELENQDTPVAVADPPAAPPAAPATPPAAPAAPPAAPAVTLSAPNGTAPVAPAASGAQTQPDIATMLRQIQEQNRTELAAFQATITAELAKASEARASIMAETMAQMREEQELAAFSMRVTSTGQHALTCTPGELQAILSGLPKANRQQVINLIDGIHKNGLVSFDEVGTAAAGKTKITLEKGMVKMLRAHLEAGGKLEEFFEANKDILGEQDQYDLAAFQQQQ